MSHYHIMKYTLHILFIGDAAINTQQDMQ